jgi:DAK2 domain fusion protein YloV
MLASMLCSAEIVLEKNREGVNALNVFPVPDGDTGTNMLLTLRAVAEETKRSPQQSLGEMAQVVSRGALLGARGNSGVILSQFLRGFATQFDGVQEADGECLARAFYQGATSAYSSVGNPVEGTMLTVMRETGEAMTQSPDLGAVDIVDLLKYGLDVCQQAVIATQEQLPVLKRAGVVDAGGKGFELMVRGFLAKLRGEDPNQIILDWASPDNTINKEFLVNSQEQVFGYCTQVMFSGSSLDPESIRSVLMEMAESTVVIGDENLVKVHVHTSDPGPVLSFGASLGTLLDVKIESMDEQHEEFQKNHAIQSEMIPLGVVTVAWGVGFESLFTTLGARTIVSGGQTMNPSCQDFLDAATRSRSDTVILLPNNRNIVSTANQAAALSGIPIKVVETTSIQQGIAAILAFNGDGDLDTNIKAMQRAVFDIQSGEVVTSIRDATLNGKFVEAGKIIGTIEDKVVCFGTSAGEVVRIMVEGILLEEGSLITLYWGGEATESEAITVAKNLKSVFPSVEFETVYGGQPYYHYLISFER